MLLGTRHGIMYLLIPQTSSKLLYLKYPVREYDLEKCLEEFTV